VCDIVHHVHFCSWEFIPNGKMFAFIQYQIPKLFSILSNTKTGPVKFLAGITVVAIYHFQNFPFKILLNLNL
jgi:hypothetical protein